MRFEEEDDEEGCKGLRRRERMNCAPTSHADEYTNETINGDLILQQCLLMVKWIIEYAKAIELQNEFIFLSISSLDRLLSKGNFTIDKNL